MISKVDNKTSLFYVIDTTALISYFSNVFKVESKISKTALEIINQGFEKSSNTKLIIPSIVFIEIYLKQKWNSLEYIETIKSEVFEEIFNFVEKDKIEIKPLEKEVIENIITINDKIVNLEGKDKIILASAMMMKCPLITSDSKIIKYNSITSVVKIIE